MQHVNGIGLDAAEAEFFESVLPVSLIHRHTLQLATCEQLVSRGIDF
jgi:hypothetical protein